MANQKKGKIKRIIAIVVGVTAVFFLLLCFLPHILSLFSSDIAPIDDSDLQLKKITILQDENAYYDLIKLEDTIYIPEEKDDLILDHLSDKIWDEEFVKEILSENKEALGYFSVAASKSSFQDPACADPKEISIDTALPSLNVWRKMSHISAIQALSLTKQGKDKEAFDEAFNSIRIGQKIQESQVPLIEYLVAMEMKKVGMETIQKMIVSSELSSEELKKYVRDMDEFYENEEGLVIALKGEYHISTKALDLITPGYSYKLNEEQKKLIKETSLYDFYFQPNKTKLYLAENIRKNIENISKPYSETEIVEISELASSSPIKLYFTENAVGKVLLDISTSNFDSVIKKKCEADLIVSTTKLLFALKAYKNDTGDLPISLNELSPQYISTIPIDPFNGKPIRYLLKKKILYSVGSDLTDSGGSVGDEWRKMPDPSFKINF